MSSASEISDHPYAFSPLPQDDSGSPISIETPPSAQDHDQDDSGSSISIETPSSAQDHEPGGVEEGHLHDFSLTGTQLANEISSQFYSSLQSYKLPENIYAIYAKFAFLILVISYTILTSRIYPPVVVFHPNSFCISNFTIFHSRLAAKWEADFTFGCENCNYNLTSGNDQESDARAYYDYIKGYIFYKDMDNALSTVSIDQPFNLGAKEHKKVHMNFGHTGWEGNQPIVREKVVNAIGKRIELGTLHLGLRLDLWVTNKKWGSFWKRSLLGIPDSYCWNLLVRVKLETGRGELILSRPIECYHSS